ncbi:unnamed protein product [Soboliphyme baturini]|uniref:Thioredoxin_12 domain-containing protein n=1 Tax=Soboliphyme baturini TaxID=241478 RepID=A0A183J347_9BILA|nr:unnamed protein product [Soboliphyme baturini]
MSQEKPDLFWQFLDNVLEDPQALANSTDKDDYNLAMRAASSLLGSQTKLDLLKFSLALRAYSPAVEMQQQIATIEVGTFDCSYIVDVNGKKTCDIRHVEDHLSADGDWKPPAVYSVDHRFLKENSGGKKIILYADVHIPQFKEVHCFLKNLATTRALDYILRFSTKNRRPSKLKLSGYSVELAIKSTEYRAQDDSKIKGVNASDGADWTDEEVNLNGFNFQLLK